MLLATSAKHIADCSTEFMSHGGPKLKITLPILPILIAGIQAIYTILTVAFPNY
jgi:hypothetical protein